jgi:hypothetical protein
VQDKSGAEQTGLAQDFDATPYMKLAWDKWHRTLATELWRRWSEGMKLKWKPQDRPFYLDYTYTVGDDRSISNFQLVTSSHNPEFDAVAEETVKGIAGSPLLKFPDGTQRKKVERYGTFWKMGHGPGYMPYVPDTQDKQIRGNESSH